MRTILLVVLLFSCSERATEDDEPSPEDQAGGGSGTGGAVGAGGTGDLDIGCAGADTAEPSGGLTTDVVWGGVHRLDSCSSSEARAVLRFGEGCEIDATVNVSKTTNLSLGYAEHVSACLPVDWAPISSVDGSDAPFEALPCWIDWSDPTLRFALEVSPGSCSLEWKLLRTLR